MARELKTMEESFWEHIIKPSDDNDCWSWDGDLRGGYGRLSINRRGLSRLAHRASWIIHNGSIPPGLSVLHRCDNPPCCNPDHLYLGTNLDNMRDRLKDGKRYLNGKTEGSLHWSTKLQEFDIAVIRWLYSRKLTQCIIGKSFGLSQGQIHNIVTGRQWDHVPYSFRRA